MGSQRGLQMMVTALVFNALSFVFVVLRCISRFWVIRQAGPEDYLIISALVLSIGTTVTIAFENFYGLGHHADTISAENSEKLAKVLYASIIVYNLGLFLTKISIVYQCLRFFVDRRYRRAAWSLIGLICVGGAAFILASCFSCWPIAFFWDVSIKGGHCVNRLAFWFSFSAFNILTDILVFVLPMPVFWHLQLPRKQKLSLIGVFALGGFGCITGILRLHAIYIVTTSTDSTYANVDAATWSAAELNVGIICACIPALRPIVSSVFPRLLSTTRRDNNSHTFPQRSTYINKTDSAVELSQVVKTQSDVSRDDTMPSFDQSHDPNSIRVKNEWTVTESERV